MVALADGPRGRRFLYELLVLCDKKHELSTALFDLHIRLTPDDGSAFVLVMEETTEPPSQLQVLKNRLISTGRRISARASRTFGHRLAAYRKDSVVRPVPRWKEGRPPERTLTTPTKIADIISSLEPVPTVEDVREALRASVDSAMYWQEPFMEDRLLSDPVIHRALAKVQIPNLDSLLREVMRGDMAGIEDADRRPGMFAATWIHEFDVAREEKPISLVLAEYSQARIQGEERAKRERPEDPTAGWSGEWSSTPTYSVLASNGMSVAGVPVALEYVEDSLGLEEADVLTLQADNVNVFVVDQAEDWAELCTTYPLDVTASVRHDWYRTTGRDGNWVIPDWYQVSKDWDAVLLTARAYLTAAGTAIPVGGAASVIAGWAPGTTYWLTDRVTVTETNRWRASSREDGWYKANNS